MTKAENKDWFYLKFGQRRGPVTADVLCRLIKDRKLHSEETKVWKEGMDDWAKLTAIKPFSTVVEKLNPESVQSQSSLVGAEAVSKAADSDMACRGVTRGLFSVLVYLGWVILILAAVAFLVELEVRRIVGVEMVGQLLVWGPLVFSALMMLWLTCSRMRNAGYPKRYGWGLFIPVVNLWVLFVCLAGRRNYRVKKLIGAIGWLNVLVFCGVVVGGVLSPWPDYHISVLHPAELTKVIEAKYRTKTKASQRLLANQSKADAILQKRESEKQKKEAEKAERARKMREKRGLE